MHIELGGSKLKMLPDRALYHEDGRMLILSDVHLGKTMHFRKNGIPIPPEGIEKDYIRLRSLIERYNPAKVIFLGDLFHSVHNSEWDLFCSFVLNFKHTEFVLVMGNHDILKKHYYDESCIRVEGNYMVQGNLILSHQPLETIPQGMYCIAGHVHPGYILSGPARQSLRFPCFYYHNRQLILPAFGSLTGMYLIEPARNSGVFVIVKEKVLRVME
jgi:uncharacterized protein